jgi:hypothetical protein
LIRYPGARKPFYRFALSSEHELCQMQLLAQALRMNS